MFGERLLLVHSPWMANPWYHAPVRRRLAGTLRNFGWVIAPPALLQIQEQVSREQAQT